MVGVSERYVSDAPAVAGPGRQPTGDLAMLFASEFFLGCIVWLHIGLPVVIAILKVIIECQTKPQRGRRRR
jgi:hypothetical protein